MGNAEPEVKLAASEVAADHNDDAVAQVLERWF
jgi:hydroxymethylpyrimidine pyrophosphatase-like HAD family hydrolase